MRLYAKCLPEYFAMLGEGKKHEFRQIEVIQIENTETHEMREFLVDDIIKLDPGRAYQVRKNFNKVLWDPKLPIFAIALGEEVRIRPAACVEAETGERDDKEEKYEFFNQKRKDEYEC